MEISFEMSSFKSFKKMTRLELKPLTILCGINACGKSSIIQSLLLMKQSISPEIGFGVPGRSRPPMILKGPFTDLGSWEDVIYCHKTRTEVEFIWYLDDSGNNKKLKKSGSSIKIGIRGRKLKDSGEFELYVSNFEFIDSNNTLFKFKYNTRTKKYDFIIEGFSIASFDRNINRIFRNTLRRSREKYESGEEENILKNIYSYLRGEMSKMDKHEKRIGRNKVEFKGMFPVTIRDIDIKEFFEKPITSLLNSLKDQIEKSADFNELIEYLEEYVYRREIISVAISDDSVINGKLIRKYREKINDLNLAKIRSYMISIHTLESEWNRFRYIGPLRSAPKRFYTFNDISKVSIGNSGENTTLVLSIEKDREIPDYYKPIFKGNRIDRLQKERDKTLLEALNDWLEIMKLPIVKTASQKSIYQLRVKNNVVEVALPDTGFGVSQILPILVESLRTKPGETLILEQPEIHLHPGLQSKLADFLICMAKSGRHFVIESHSEYIIKRICLRIAQDEEVGIKDLINVQFVEPDRGNGSTLIPVKINEYGSIENWPPGFFDENDSSSIMEAGLKKKMKRMKK